MGAFAIWFFAAQAVIGTVSGALAAAGIISADTFKIISAVIGGTLPIPGAALGVAHLQTAEKTDTLVLAVDGLPPSVARGLVSDMTRSKISMFADQIRNTPDAKPGAFQKP